MFGGVNVWQIKSTLKKTDKSIIGHKDSKIISKI